MPDGRDPHAPPPRTDRDLRKFGVVMAVAAGVIAAWLLWRGRGFGPWLLGLSALFAVAAWLRPAWLAPLERWWMRLALVLGAVMTRVILSLAFFLVVTPIGLVMRMLGRDGLRRQWPPEAADSYWIPTEPDGPGTRPEKPY